MDSYRQVRNNEEERRVVTRKQVTAWIDEQRDTLSSGRKTASEGGVFGGKIKCGEKVEEELGSLRSCPHDIVSIRN